MSKRERTKLDPAYQAELKSRIEKDFPYKASHGDPTMAWVFQEYLFEYNELGKNIGIFRDDFKMETAEQYMNYCCSHLFPPLKYKAIADLVAEDFDEILDTIKVDTGYGEATMDHIRLQIWRICQAGYQHGHCEDILWGTHYYRGNQKEKTVDSTSIAAVPKRTFSPQEEEKILSHLLDHPETDMGQNIAMGIMALTGLRNNEVCGLNIGDFRPLGKHPTNKLLWIFKTTKINSNEIKAGGKTRNAIRVLPLINRLAHFIEQRIIYLQSKIDDGTLPPETDLSQLPLACYKDDYTRRCSSRDITSAGRNLFKLLGLSQQDISRVSDWVRRAYRAGLIEEKDATTYTFRRNFATHLKNLGLPLHQIQYYIGHDITDPYIHRSDVALEESLTEIKAILDYYPPRIPEKLDPIPESQVFGGYGCTKPRDIAHHFHLITEEDNATYLITTKATVATDTVQIKICGNHPFDIETIY